jgi:hypothetical protein
MLLQLGFEASCVGVARIYQDICGTFVIDSVDAPDGPRIEALGMRVVACSTVMRSFEDKCRLAEEVLQLCHSGQAKSARESR